MSSEYETRQMKSWRAQRLEHGERNARNAGLSEGTQNGDFFSTKNPRIKYPVNMLEHPRQTYYYPEDPFQHLGRIGYTRNTYQFSGANKDENNIFGSQHMKKTAWLEEMRRRQYAEKYGIDAEIDKTNVAGTAEAYYLRKAPKNKYIYDNQWKNSHSQENTKK